ncbi:MAG: MazG nucleotide pyrophosphohydrolase domain-containing protein, partial [Dermatophilaceae bacterium]
MSTGRLRLLQTTPRVAPGLLTREAWQAVADAAHLACRDVADPLAAAVADAGFVVQPVDPPDEPVPALARRLVGAAGSDDVVWLGSVDGDPGLADAIAAEVSRLESPPEVEVLLGSWDVPGARLLDVVAAMDRLRSPGGCPWDAEQTHESLVPYLIEEAHEVIAAIEGGDRAHLAEELGDVLLQVVFHARVAEDAADGTFDVDTVAGLLVEKLVRRHPHVFADGDASTPDEVEQEWERIKGQEKAVREPGRSDGGAGAAADGEAPAGAELLHGIPPTLPVELTAAKV